MATRRSPAWLWATLVVFPVVVAAAGAFAVASRAQPIYAARSEVIFDIRRLPWDTAERFLATEIVVAQSRALLSPVADRFRMPVEELERKLSAETVRNSGVVRLQYENADPSLALDVTRAVTDGYLATLRDIESLEDAALRVLTPPFLLEEPVSPKPLRAAAIGAVVGMALAAAAVILRARLWRTRQA